MDNLHLIIVEDEPAILNGIVMLVRRINLPLTITGTYSNGQEALNDLTHSTPDIVITDVQMPVMSGLQLIEATKSQGHHAKYIVLSGYAEFEYVKTALELGVQHYLLKSPSISELKNTLSSLCDTIYRDRYEKHHQYFQDLLFQQSQSLKQLPNIRDLSFHFYLYTVGPLQKLTKESYFSNNHISNTSTLALITKHFPRSEGQIWVLNSYCPNTKVILATSDKENNPMPNDLFELLTQQNSKDMHSVTLIHIRKLDDVQKLHNSLLSAMHYLQKSIKFGQHQFLIPTSEVFPPVVDMLSKPELDTLYKVLSSNRTDFLIKQYKYFSKTWTEQSYSQLECTSLTKHYLTEVCLHFSGKDTSALKKIALDELSHITDTAKSYEEFFNACKLLLETILDNSHCFSGNKKADDIVEQLYQHILTNFTQEIDINIFAKNQGYHPIYLITLFTKNKGISPTKLIIQLRIKQAKDMLLSTDMSLKDIAESVGYCDVSYFSRIFKEREGISPGNYRKTEKVFSTP